MNAKYKQEDHKVSLKRIRRRKTTTTTRTNKDIKYFTASRLSSSSSLATIILFFGFIFIYSSKGNSWTTKNPKPPFWKAEATSLEIQSHLFGRKSAISFKSLNSLAGHLWLSMIWLLTIDGRNEEPCLLILPFSFSPTYSTKHTHICFRLLFISLGFATSVSPQWLKRSSENSFKSLFQAIWTDLIRIMLAQKCNNDHRPIPLKETENLGSPKES